MPFREAWAGTEIVEFDDRDILSPFEVIETTVKKHAYNEQLHGESKISTDVAAYRENLGE